MGLKKPHAVSARTKNGDDLVLIVDDFGLDAMDTLESRDTFEIFPERHRRFTSNAYDLVIEDEPYRSCQMPDPRPLVERLSTLAPSGVAYVGRLHYLSTTLVAPRAPGVELRRPPERLAGTS